MGLAGGATDDIGQTAVGFCKVFAQSDPEDPFWDWPQGLLPICHWGCAIYSCIDCTSDDAMILTWDPNGWDDGTSPTTAIFPIGMTLFQWLEAWASGVNLWDRMYPAP